MNKNDRYSRQRDLVPADRLVACRPTVIGLGAVGRQVAWQLAAMGVTWLQLVDAGRVKASNLATQGFLEDDLRKPKVEATAELCRKINHGLEVHALVHRFRRDMEVGRVIFCCVDGSKARRQIWQAVQHRVDFFSDGRMAAEVLRVVTVAEPAGRWHYLSTLLADQDDVAAPSTAKAAIYAANVAAGLMLSQFAKWLRRLPVDFDCQLDVATDEMTVGQPVAIARQGA
jgi:sulfur carrier protein ThiS adenylyltransferase